MTTVEIRTVSGSSLAVGSSGPRTVTIDRAKESGGLGLGFNGGELLLLAIGGCYSNDVFREAAERGLIVKNVQVTVNADWAGDPVGRRMFRSPSWLRRMRPKRKLLS